MYALPAAAPPAPQRQILVGTSLAVMAAVMMTGSMLAVWALQRREAIDLEGSWLPDGVTIPEVPDQRHPDRVHRHLCLRPVGALPREARRSGPRRVGARLHVPRRDPRGQRPGVRVHPDGLGIGDGTYAAMFYAITGFFMLLMIVGLLFTTVAAFRFIGGRTADRDLLAAHALYWYAMAVIYAAIWFLVYVTK